MSGSKYVADVIRRRFARGAKCEAVHTNRIPRTIEMCGCGTSLLDDKMPFSRGADTTHRPPHTDRQPLIGWLFRLSIVALYDACLVGSHGICVDPTSTFDVFGDPSAKPRIDPAFPLLAQI
ncbi:hypothetical protein OIU79_022417 [Salix purpurea]|uniref:Uncharacterized protein n=1 Tax=Salix purpurea TaxID=77065 RepID=A0A9Q0WFS5_SALPP|nr:hypothetical protein OIU79_022417 [Salix purpurea]